MAFRCCSRPAAADPEVHTPHHLKVGSVQGADVLLAFDFARAYDTVDHCLLRTSLMEAGLPRCLVQWTWQFLRDRRARVEVNGFLSRERVFRAGLPQGSVLAPTLFLLWAAPLATALRSLPGVSPFLYADDTATLCAGNDITSARNRAQTAADTLVAWARRSKMTVAGEKTQMLVLSQWARDSSDCSIKVAGKTVAAAPTLKLLGITLDRLLHFGPHCRQMRQKTRPRIAQLRHLTGRNWGLGEQMLRVVANGYVRGALEHAAAAWLPATPPSHVELLERELRAAARVITGCPISTPSHAVMAEAGLAPVADRRLSLAGRFLAKARSLPATDPLRTVADTTVNRRLTSITGWRDLGEEAWRLAGMVYPIEPAPPLRPPPWTPTDAVTITLHVGEGLRPDATPTQKKTAATLHLAGLPQCATWMWTDGSAEGGVLRGGAGAYIEFPDGEEIEVRRPAGMLCSSFRAEMVALQAALTTVRDRRAHLADPIVVCTDSQAALACLRSGPASQSTTLGTEVWQLLLELTRDGRHINLQWVPSHCDIRGNERADRLAREASALPQADTAVDTRTVQKAVAREASKRTLTQRPPGWYRTLMEVRLPPPVSGVSRAEAVDIHQLRAGHWSGSALYLHRIGKNPSRQCPQCDDPRCPAGLCTACREENDTPAHVLLRCPALMALRHRLTGGINLTTEETRRDDVIAALTAAYRWLQSHLATPPPGGRRE